MKKMLIIIAVMLAAGAAVLLLRNRKEPVPEPSSLKDPGTEQTLLVDYIRRTVATAGGDGYSETVLYLNSDGTAQVHFYSRYEPEEKEHHTAYSVDSAVIEEVYAIISDERISSWNDRKYLPGPDGAVYVLKYRTADGEYIRVSSDSMPEDGIGIIGKINTVMGSYAENGEEIGISE